MAEAKSNRIQKFTRDGQFIAAIGEGILNQPWGMFVDSDDNIYVADWGNNRGVKLSPGGDCWSPMEETAQTRVQMLTILRASPVTVRVMFTCRTGAISASRFTSRRCGNHGALWRCRGVQHWAAEVINSNPDAQKAYRRVKDRTTLGLFERPVGLTVDSEDRIIITDSTRGRLQVYAKEKDYMDPQFNL